VAHAVLVEGYLAAGKDLISALELVSELGEVKVDSERSRPKPRAVVASNEASMKMLEGMLASVPNAPTKKKPRKTK
jgi:hypothetical protein